MLPPLAWVSRLPLCPGPRRPRSQRGRRSPGLLAGELLRGLAPLVVVPPYRFWEGSVRLAGVGTFLLPRVTWIFITPFAGHTPAVFGGAHWVRRGVFAGIDFTSLVRPPGGNLPTPEGSSMQ